MANNGMLKELAKKLPIEIATPLIIVIVTFCLFAHLHQTINPTIPYGGNITNVEVLLILYPFELLLIPMTISIFLLLYMLIYWSISAIKKLRSLQDKQLLNKTKWNTIPYQYTLREIKALRPNFFYKLPTEPIEPSKIVIRIFTPSIPCNLPIGNILLVVIVYILFGNTVIVIY